MSGAMKEEVTVPGHIGIREGDGGEISGTNSQVCHQNVDTSGARVLEPIWQWWDPVGMLMMFKCLKDGSKGHYC